MNTSVQTVLLAGSFPDRLNTNVRLRRAAAEGFRECMGGAPAVRECRHDELPVAVAGNRPDLVLLMGSCHADQLDYGPLRAACDRAGSRLAFWLHDDPYEFDTNQRACEVADFVFTSDRWAARHYSHPQVFHLPLAACPATHRRDPHGQRYVDLFFCGVAFPNRVDLLRDLAPGLAGANATVYGEGWPEDLLAAFCKNERLDEPRVADFHAASRLTLNVGRHLDLANRRFQLPASTPGPRTFEAAMAGAAQLVFLESTEILDYFEPGEEVLLFNDPAEAATVLLDFRRDDRLAARVGAAAQRRALAEHTYVHRARRLLRCIQGKEKPG